MSEPVGVIANDIEPLKHKEGHAQNAQGGLHEDLICDAITALLTVSTLGRDVRTVNHGVSCLS